LVAPHQVQPAAANHTAELETLAKLRDDGLMRGAGK
jgi:hypothetical protein